MSSGSRSRSHLAEGVLKKDVEVFRHCVHVRVAELPENVARTVVFECDFALTAFPQEDPEG
ncbi:hypothetical protein GCM10023194_29520 [Planotetraspora phitsanulokensis]|uniref:Uncharacterized protein n=1 Tax=Planotetraspora phitsanulokensis TaxID=575192 RepID=A0A8J3UBA7_9ACTN|nr:hypothetical protein Pph01_09130 [Planotetraspora phitsanulokensis]